MTVLDASALLALLKKEVGFKVVRSAMANARAGKSLLYMNEINLGEVYYTISRERTREAARFFLYERFPLLPVIEVPSSMDMIIAAAELKAGYNLHYLDGFAAATTEMHDAILLTADRDFEKVAARIKINWLR